MLQSSPSRTVTFNGIHCVFAGHADLPNCFKSTHDARSHEICNQPKVVTLPIWVVLTEMDHDTVISSSFYFDMVSR